MIEISSQRKHILSTFKINLHFYLIQLKQHKVETETIIKTINLICTCSILCL